MSFAEGENIGPYRIMEQLGQGGMATVFKAYHAALDRYVALKVLHPAFREDKTFTGRFQREARVVAKLEHPSIVPIYDYAEHQNRPYLVMKYIQGDTLKARLSRGPLNAEEITQVVDAVGAALSYAHQEGILHRDVKPSNVLIQEDGKMYLADFGLARIAQAGESTLSSDSIMGTPQYISPEQARGDKELDEGTDIYSFGVMLYELVVGQVPFSADTPFSIIHDHIYTPLPMPRSINKNVPESVERVLLKALAKERTDRYEDVASMVQAFKDAWESAGVPMKGTALTLPAATVKRGGKKSKKKVSKEAVTAVGKEQKKKRSPWPFVAAGVLLMVCCVFVFFALRKNRMQPVVNQDPEPAPTEMVELPPEPDLEPELPEPAPPPGQEELPPEVAEAQQVVDEHPEDPNAWLDLALRFWDVGQRREAYETLNHAAELAQEDEGFLMDAGRQFHERQAWIGSAAMFLRVHKRIGIRGDVPEEVVTLFHEAVYMAANAPGLEREFPLLEEVMRVDQPIGLVGQARHTFYIGEFREAEIKLNKAREIEPNMPEIRLLEAEMLVIENRCGEAELILIPLRAGLDNPEWIRLLAEEFYTRCPN